MDVLHSCASSSFVLPFALLALPLTLLLLASIFDQEWLELPHFKCSKQILFVLF
jgi:hypothetical protein